MENDAGWRLRQLTVVLAVLVALGAGCSPQPATGPASISPAPSPSAPNGTTVPVGSSPLPPSQWPTTAWEAAAPEVVGLDSQVLADGLQELAAHGSQLHSLLVIRHGLLVLDAYKYPYDGSIYHDLASVTKSITTTLIGIAAERDLLDLDAPILSFFPDRTVVNGNDEKWRITVRHLLNLTSGLECRVTSEEITLAQMLATDDWVQFALDRDLVAEPGARFSYCSPDMHLLSAVLTRATGMSAHQFARENLFGPLGIAESYWPADPAGNSHGWGGLALRPRDAAKIGLLFLHRGRWGETQVVSAEWVAAATSAQAGVGGYKAEDYGYGWWVSRPASEPVPFFRADGNGGQRILVVPAFDLVIVSTGAGFSLEEAVPFIVAAATDGWEPLPVDPPALARMADAAAALAAAPAADRPRAVPDLAAAISGRAITFDSNAYEIRSMTLTFPAGAAEAAARFDAMHESPTRDMVIGLDGRWRASRAGRPILARGAWTDAVTFEMQIDEGPGIGNYTARLRFEGDRVYLDLLGVADEVVTIRGHL